MYVIRLNIDQTEYFNALAGKRFALINKCRNILCKHAMHLLNRLGHDRQYQAMLLSYRKAGAGTPEAKAVGEQMNDYRESIGLSKSGLESYVSVWQHRYKEHISSHQAQKEAARIMAGVDKVIFGNGSCLHFRKLSQTTTICSKSKINGLSFDREHMAFKWMGETFKLKPIDKNNTYMAHALYPDGTNGLPVKYCELKRMMFPNGWYYYLHVYVNGTAPQKHAIGKGKAGIDPGTSTMAALTDHKAILRELAPGTDSYTVRIKHTLKAMDRSRRDSNPGNFNPDGTVIKGSSTWNKSKKYKWLQRKYQSLCRQKASYVKQSHCILANEILGQADSIIVEHMDYKGLQRRSKKTERQDKVSTVTDNKGKQQHIYKYKKKKRFGKSIGSRAPSEFLTILKQKAAAAGGQYNEVDTRAFKASQYDHSDGTYKKVTLGTRFKKVDGVLVQRDLYSAFLIKHSRNSLDAPNRLACIKDFKKFVKLQNKEIKFLKASGQSMPGCFGF